MHVGLCTILSLILCSGQVIVFWVCPAIDSETIFLSSHLCLLFLPFFLSRPDVLTSGFKFIWLRSLFILDLFILVYIVSVFVSMLAFRIYYSYKFFSAIRFQRLVETNVQAISVFLMNLDLMTPSK